MGNSEVSSNTAMVRREIALEIFTEIEALIKPNSKFLWKWDLERLREIKEKYTGGSC